MPAPKVPQQAPTPDPVTLPETPAPAETPLADGPKMGKRGEFLPATYRLQNGLIRTDR